MKEGITMSDYRNNSVEKLFSVISEIDSPEECRAFLEDLCTIKEIQDMAQRLDTAILLDKGYSYQKISDMVGVSTATISRVNRALTYGSNGYRTVIDKMKETGTDNDNQ